jgi:hypothetical protein
VLQRGRTTDEEDDVEELSDDDLMMEGEVLEGLPELVPGPSVTEAPGVDVTGDTEVAPAPQSAPPPAPARFAPLVQLPSENNPVLQVSSTDYSAAGRAHSECVSRGALLLQGDFSGQPDEINALDPTQTYYLHADSEGAYLLERSRTAAEDIEVILTIRQFRLNSTNESSSREADHDIAILIEAAQIQLPSETSDSNEIATMVQEMITWYNWESGGSIRSREYLNNQERLPRPITGEDAAAINDILGRVVTPQVVQAEPAAPAPQPEPEPSPEPLAPPSVIIEPAVEEPITPEAAVTEAEEPASPLPFWQSLATYLRQDTSEFQTFGQIRRGEATETRESEREEVPPPPSTPTAEPRAGRGVWASTVEYLRQDTGDYHTFRQIRRGETTETREDASEEAVPPPSTTTTEPRARRGFWNSALEYLRQDTGDYRTFRQIRRRTESGSDE